MRLPCLTILSILLNLNLLLCPYFWLRLLSHSANPRTHATHIHRSVRCIDCTLCQTTVCYVCMVCGGVTRLTSWPHLIFVPPSAPACLLSLDSTPFRWFRQEPKNDTNIDIPISIAAYETTWATLNESLASNSLIGWQLCLREFRRVVLKSPSYYLRETSATLSLKAVIFRWLRVVDKQQR